MEGRFVLEIQCFWNFSSWVGIFKFDEKFRNFGHFDFYKIFQDGNGIYVNTDPTTGGKNGTSVRASTTYRIVNAEDQRCMDIYYGAGDSDGAVVNWVVTNDCSSADTQKWIFTDIASTSYVCAYGFFIWVFLFLG